ncbi:MAG: response regulator transcription factor [Acetatifactor sp.]|nr:response regulator transcription factor [Acetatifactor sp.]
MNKILLLEDDASLIDGLSYSLKKNDFDTTIARTVKEAIYLLNDINKFDLLILDVTLPDGTGFEVCEKVREQDTQIPIIFLTASDEEVSVIRGLDSGGDDYITKPFKLGELCSRIRALLRRAGATAQNNSSLIKCGDIAIDLMGSRALLRGEPLDLTITEYRLLCLLVQNPNQILTRNSILERLWDSSGDFVDDNTLSVYVRRLREKIEKDPFHPEHLITVRGFGYQWKEASI